MSIESRLWMEVPFNIAYLLVIWGLVVAMLRNGRAVAAPDKPVARRVLCTFVVLGLGDTPHVISRILAWVHGSMSITFTVFGWQLSTVGLGALATLRLPPRCTHIRQYLAGAGGVHLLVDEGGALQIGQFILVDGDAGLLELLAGG